MYVCVTIVIATLAVAVMSANVALLTVVLGDTEIAPEPSLLNL